MELSYWEAILWLFTAAYIGLAVGLHIERKRIRALERIIEALRAD